MVYPVVMQDSKALMESMKRRLYPCRPIPFTNMISLLKITVQDMHTVVRAILALKDEQTPDIIRICDVLERHDYANKLRGYPCRTMLHQA